MRESRTSGSVRGDRGNPVPYRHRQASGTVSEGMTPIPYKLITIASGVVRFDLISFIAASIISRSLRFFLLAGLLWWFGDFAREFIEQRLTLVTTIFAVLLVAGFVVLRYL